jgi:hypothetical protein
VSTTAIVVELLVVGLQALAWAIVLVLAFTGVPADPTKKLHELSDWAPMLSAFGIAAAYTLGILVDRLSDGAFAKIDARIQSEEIDDPKFHQAKARLEVMHESPGMTAFIEYIRSRVRIARSTTMNALLGTIATSVFFAMRDDWRAVLLTIIIGAVATTAAHLTWKSIMHTYYRRLSDALERVHVATRSASANPR